MEVTKLYDASFRENLKENPHASIRELGYDISSDVKIVVKTNSSQKIYFPISESSEINLENINAAGGICIMPGLCY